MGLKPADVEAQYAGQAPVAAAAPVAQAPVAAPPGPVAAPPGPPAMGAAPPAAAPPAYAAPPNPLAMRGAPAAPVAASAAPLGTQAIASSTADARLDQILANQEDIKKHLKLIDVATAVALRNCYNTPGDFNCASILRDFNIPLPE